jgi:N-acylneuraminate cytidylyltransferase
MAVALVPARSGSKRIQRKNVRTLAGHPLIAYTIAAARASGVFGAVVVSTDSEETARIARHYGAETPFLRPAEMSQDRSPDIEWIEHALGELARAGRAFEAFAILRPTSPFRLPDTIRRAWSLFLAEEGVDSLRAVERCSQHPGKMWVVRGRRLLPLLPFATGVVPWHSTPTQSLPEVYVQNASLEIAWIRTVQRGGSIAGETVVPFVTEGLEGFDLNHPDDWDLAELQLARGAGTLPRVHAPPWNTAPPPTGTPAA